MKFCSCFYRKEKPVTILTLNEKSKITRRPSEKESGAVPDGPDGMDSTVDWKIAENKKANHTECYDQDNVIVRRDGTIKLTAKFSREINEMGDVLGFELKTGKKPNLKAGTMVRMDCEIDGDLCEDHWSATASASGNDANIAIYVPPDAAIGRYTVRIYIRTVTSLNEISTVYSSQPAIYVVANPYSEKDQCYCSTASHGFLGLFNTFDEFIDEYVLNEVGAIWRGSSTNFRPKQWTFGQFQEPVLDVACQLLQNDSRVAGAATGAKLADLVQIVRIMSAAANSNDDNGVITGNWSGEYSDGKHPISWHSSVSIIEQYVENGYKPVKYGQCWVFSGILTTLLRALGIPARSVTNFQSAHDTDNTMTIDVYVDKMGNEHMKSDSCWNFHVWNECWLNRRDLPDGYAGWQAVDATPQEDANGISQCGPAPVSAIKKGETFVNYDTNFVYGEVNADRCTWLCEVGDDDSIFPVALTSRRRDAVGMFISTKAPGVSNFEREDITDSYKFEEGTSEEKASFEKAFSYTGMRPNRSYMKNNLIGENKTDFKISITQANSTPKMGSNIELTVKLTNNSGAEIELASKPVITVNSTYHLGGVSGTIYQGSMDVWSVEKESSNLVTVTHEMYKNKLAPDGFGFVRAICLVSVKNGETVDTFSDQLDFVIEVPDEMIEISLSHLKCRVEDPDVSTNIIVTNKLPYVLTNVLLTVDGRGLFRTQSSPIKELAPGYRVETTVPFIPKKAGKFTIMVDVDSAEMKDIKNFATIEVLGLINSPEQ